VDKTLSILIPARKEIFLNNTIKDILKNIRGETEIIVVCDGGWPPESIPDNPQVTVIHHSEARGQRAATNDAARLSQAKYVMKCDAHCAFDEGFDIKMMEHMQDDWTMVPTMYNLHAFNWLCPRCGKTIYQGPTPGRCEKCNEEMRIEMVWKPKPSPETTAMRFDKDLKFQYWSGYKKQQEGDLVETMSLLGACWMLTREKYWELAICDEAHGGWGQQGTEVACKTWLSGGRVICNKHTWFAHMFRTQGGDFGFPYPISGEDQDKAREYSRRLWLHAGWDKAVLPLEWLIKKFKPPGWDEEEKMTKGIIYYTSHLCDEQILEACRRNLLKACGDIPIISVSLQPLSFGSNLYLNRAPGVLTMFKQILTGLEHCQADIVFFAEHDILYHPSHFDFVPPKRDEFYYNENTWKVDSNSGQALFYHTKQTSGLCAYRELLIEHYRRRVAKVEKDGFSRHMGFEPGCHAPPRGVDSYKAQRWMSEYPNIDIRHSSNWTANRWHKEQFRSERSIRGWKESDSVPGWGQTAGQFQQILQKV